MSSPGQPCPPGSPEPRVSGCAPRQPQLRARRLERSLGAPRRGYDPHRHKILEQKMPLLMVD